MATVLLTPVQAAFVAWNRARPVRRLDDPQPSHQETFEAGYRAGMLAEQPQRKRNKKERS